MKGLIMTLGTRGDVQPFVALARALDAAGHEAVLCAPHRFADFATGNGVTFAGVDDGPMRQLDTPAEAGEAFGGGIRARLRQIREMPSMFDQVLADSWQVAADCLGAGANSATAERRIRDVRDTTHGDTRGQAYAHCRFTLVLLCPLWNRASGLRPFVTTHVPDRRSASSVEGNDGMSRIHIDGCGLVVALTTLAVVAAAPGAVVVPASAPPLSTLATCHTTRSATRSQRRPSHCGSLDGSRPEQRPSGRGSATGPRKCS